MNERIYKQSRTVHTAVSSFEGIVISLDRWIHFEPRRSRRVDRSGPHGWRTYPDVDW